MSYETVFKDHVVNSSPDSLRLSNPNIFLETGAEIRNSSVSDGLYMERFSGLNRSTTKGPCGIGSFSYVNDTDLAPYCHIGPRSSLGGFEHPLDSLSQSSFLWGQNLDKCLQVETLGSEIANSKPHYKRTTLQADIWIGANCVIKAGITLGVGSTIGAGSVLTKATKPYGVYVGNPAKLLKFRFPNDIVERLVNSKWWELPTMFLASIDLHDIVGALNKIQNYTALHRSSE